MAVLIVGLLFLSLGSTVAFAQTLSQITLVPGANPSAFGSSLTLTATMSSPSATGTVTFKDGPTVLGNAPLVSGKASFSTSTLSFGQHSLTAVYGGDAHFLPATSDKLALTVTAGGTTVSLASTPNPSVFGNSVTFSATISPATGQGMVTFFDNGRSLGVGGISGGVATLSTSALTTGSHSITASYGGFTALSESVSNTLIQTVNATGTLRKDTVASVASGVNPATEGSSVSFTATILPGDATGDVTFYDGNRVLGVGKLSGGSATFSIATLARGSHAVFATYNSDGSYGRSTSNVLKQVINGNGTTGSTTTITQTGCPDALSAQVSAVASALEAFTAAERAAWRTWSLSVSTGVTNGGAATQAALRAAQATLIRSINQSRQQYTKTQSKALSTVQAACRNVR